MSHRIAVDSNIHFGKPCVAGTRIPVVDVLELVEDGVAFEEIATDYFPDLAVDDVRACVRYAIQLSEAEEIHLGFAS